MIDPATKRRKRAPQGKHQIWQEKKI